MGHRRIKRKPSKQELGLLLNRILFPGDNTDIPAKFQPLIRDIERRMKQNTEIVNLQYDALFSCGEWLDGMAQKAADYSGPSSDGIVKMLKHIEYLRVQVDRVLDMCVAYDHLSEENTVESLKAIEYYHDRVYGAMYTMLGECRDWLKFLTTVTPDVKDDSEHPIWEILRQVEEAFAAGCVSSKEVRSIIKEQL